MGASLGGVGESASGGLGMRSRMGTRRLSTASPASSSQRRPRGPRVLPTTAATTLRKENPPVVLDGPFAETKEQLLGFYIVDCKNLDEALDVARDLGEANPGGAYEIRPVGILNPGSIAT